MEGCRIFKKIFVKPSHLPTLMLAIGYAIYWAEIYFLKAPRGHTTLLASLCFIIWALASLCYHRDSLLSVVREWKKGFLEQNVIVKSMLCFGGLLAVIILLCALKASLYPPHLVQETDALVYHLTLPRQHLILGSFKHIPWSMADLYFLPIDFALAPYWLVTELPNKIPQFLFLIGFIVMAAKLTRTFSQKNFLSVVCIVFAVIGSHNVGIQMGTAMLDISMCYLLLAALDSFLDGDAWLCALESAFYLWAKSFIPIQVVLIALLMFLAYRIFLKLGFTKIAWNINDIFSEGQKRVYARLFKKVFMLVILLSVLIGGPFIGKSLYYAHTPLFPFFPGTIDVGSDIDKGSVAWKSLTEKAQMAVATRDQYGSGRAPLELIKHFWLIAVPEKGVNNRYDYPVGLVYLLCLGPFIFMLVSSIKQRRFAVLPFFVVFYWVLWWMGSHQTRFLFAPIMLMLIIVCSEKRFLSKVFFLCVILALSSTFISVFRAHKSDFGKTSLEVLREKDKALLKMSQTVNRGESVSLEFFDVAFADFPVDVINTSSVFVIERVKAE